LAWPTRLLVRNFSFEYHPELNPERDADIWSWYLLVCRFIMAVCC